MESPGDFMCEYVHVPSTVAIAGGRGGGGGRGDIMAHTHCNGLYDCYMFMSLILLYLLRCL